MKFYLDAGTTYSKIICDSLLDKNSEIFSIATQYFEKDNKTFVVVPTKKIKTINLVYERTCGHMGKGNFHENEIVALTKGAQKYISENATVLDMGSRDVKWIKLKNGKFKDMDWNTSCASSTGATVEMLLKFYDVSLDDLEYCEEKFPVTCGIFGLEKIMDDISKNAEAKDSISKFIHGIAYNAWNFAKKPKKLYLSGGFCDNKCFCDSLKTYCDVKILGRFILCEGLMND